MSLILSDMRVFMGGQCRLQIDGLRLPSTGLIGVIGPNGAGKSTLLRALAGELRHQGTKTLDQSWPAPERIGFMPQNYTVRAAMTVEECVLLGRRESLGWRISSSDRAEVARALRKLNIEHLAGARMDRLSGGQQQRVLLAQRISRAPRMLLLDEPTSALDVRYQLEVLRLLKEISHDMLVVAALHDLTLAARYGDKLVLVDQGTVKAHGDHCDVLAHDTLADCYEVAVETLKDRNGRLVFVAHAAN